MKHYIQKCAKMYASKYQLHYEILFTMNQNYVLCTM